MFKDILRTVYYHTTKCLYAMLTSIVPVRNRALFISFNGTQYSDSPKAISNELHSLMPNVEQIWLFRNLDRNIAELPEWIHPVKLNTINYWRTLMSSRIWVSNFEMPVYVTKKSEQLYIQTYHADRPFKKVLYLSKNRMTLPLMESIDKNMDYLVTGSTFAEYWLPLAFKSNAKCLKIGLPRNDILFNHSSEDVVRIRKSIGLNEKCSVVLYAPTYRGVNAEQSTQGLDLERLIDILELKTNQRWICLVRKHSLSAKISYGSEGRIIDVSDYPDTNEILVITDMLITDYSSIITDFALLKRFAIQYVPDFEDYKHYRSVFDNLKSPFKKFYNFESLSDYIERCDIEYEAIETYNAFIQYYGVYEDGNASYRAAKTIEEYIRD